MCARDRGVHAVQLVREDVARVIADELLARVQHDVAVGVVLPRHLNDFRVQQVTDVTRRDVAVDDVLALDAQGVLQIGDHDAVTMLGQEAKQHIHTPKFRAIFWALAASPSNTRPEAAHPTKHALPQTSRKTP